MLVDIARLAERFNMRSQNITYKLDNKRREPEQPFVHWKLLNTYFCISPGSELFTKIK